MSDTDIGLRRALKHLRAIGADLEEIEAVERALAVPEQAPEKVVRGGWEEMYDAAIQAQAEGERAPSDGGNDARTS